MSDVETKSIALDLSSRKGKKKLEALLKDGWQIVTQNKRSILQWGPLMTDLTLTRTKG